MRGYGFREIDASSQGIVSLIGVASGDESQRPKHQLRQLLQPFPRISLLQFLFNTDVLLS